MKNIKQKSILFLSSISHATTQNWIWKKSLSIMIVPCNCCLLLELSVSTVLAHTFWTLAELQHFFCPYLSNKHKTFHVVYCRLLSQLQGSWLFPSDTHSSHGPTVCLYKSPLSTLPLKYSLTIPSPTQCNSLTTYININKAHNFL